MPLKLLILGWGFGGALLLISIWLSTMNAIIAWKLYVRKVPAPSWIPVMGGMCGVFGLIFIPGELAHKLCWLPLLLDYGSLPGFLHTAIFYVIYYSRRRN
jgi:hypothetical protein